MSPNETGETVRKVCLFKAGTAVQVAATDGVRYTGTLIRPARGAHGRSMVVRLDDVGGLYGGSTHPWNAERITRAY